MSGGGGDRTSTSTTVQELSPEQQKLLNLVIPTATEFAKNPPKDYPGIRIAPINPLEQQAQQTYLNTTAPAVGQVGANAAGAQQFLTSGAVLDPNNNPGLQGAINAAVRPITEQFTQSVLPNIRGGAIQAGGYGGTAQGKLEALAASEYGRSVGDTASNIAYKGYESGLDALTKGLYATPTIQQGLASSPGIVGAVGEQQRLFQQAEIDEAVRKYTTEQLLPFLTAKEIAGLAFGIQGGTSTTEAIAPSAQGNAYTGVLGGASTGAMAGSSMGPWGTAGGAAIGALLGYLGSR